MSSSLLQHRIEYGLARALEAAVGAVSPRAAERAGEVIGGLVRSPLAIRAGVVEENLRRAFPGADDAWIDATARESYRNFGREVVTMLRLSTLDRGRLDAMLDIADEEWRAVEEARREGRGLIFATGHYGSWEMAAAAVAAHGIPIEAIVKRQSNPLVNGRIEAARRVLGVETVDMGQAARRVPRALLAGKAVGIVADQDARGSGVWVPFFGTPASTHRGPALFALRLGSPLFSAISRRQRDGRYRLSARRIDTERRGSLDEDVHRVTAAVASHLEEEIRLDPAQYFWFHKRWKTPPPEETSQGLPGTTDHDPPAADDSGISRPR
ncbi:MAG: lysophospholipid acyltransferase family protein [Gemmatimonadota bacterium]